MGNLKRETFIVGVSKMVEIICKYDIGSQVYTEDFGWGIVVDVDNGLTKTPAARVSLAALYGAAYYLVKYNIEPKSFKFESAIYKNPSEGWYREEYLLDNPPSEEEKYHVYILRWIVYCIDSLKRWINY
jgi:hypothetical protein